MRLKICDSHLTCKVASKFLNVPEWMEVTVWDKRWFSPFPCCPVSRYCPLNKTLTEKKNEAANFNADIADDINFKSFEYKAKLLQST